MKLKRKLRSKMFAGTGSVEVSELSPEGDPYSGAANDGPTARVAKRARMEKQRKISPYKPLTKPKKKTPQLKTDDFYLVPWRDEEEWRTVCGWFKDKKYAEVIDSIAVWRERVPTLPVGVEATAVMLRAVQFDDNTSTTEELRSLYSLAVVRFLNLVSNLATRDYGESGHVPLMKMAKYLNVPDWLVEIRQEVSHGAALPSKDLLKAAGDVVLKWLVENYWTGSYGAVMLADTGSRSAFQTAKADKLKRMEEFRAQNEADLIEKVRDVIACILACKIQSMRGCKKLTDPDILKHCQGDTHAGVTSKAALGNLKMKLGVLLRKKPMTVCQVIADDLIANEEFLDLFAVTFSLESCDDRKVMYEKCRSVWAPILMLVKKKRKLVYLCYFVAQYFQRNDLSKETKELTGYWLDIITNEVGQDDSDELQSRKKLMETLEITLMQSASVPVQISQRLMEALDSHLAPGVSERLNEIADIFLDTEVNEDMITPRSKRRKMFQPFTLDQITGDSAEVVNTAAKEVDKIMDHALEIVNPIPLHTHPDFQNWMVY